MTPNSQSFDYWIRNRFVELNTDLEKLYSIQNNRSNIDSLGEGLKQQLENEGKELISMLLIEYKETMQKRESFNKIVVTKSTIDLAVDEEDVC
jgi:hypothetical protein